LSPPQGRKAAGTTLRRPFPVWLTQLEFPTRREWIPLLGLRFTGSGRMILGKQD
jgi:hypothetical protein